MKDHIYEYITNACLLVAVCSAIFFERAGSFSWLVGALGILAGVTTASAYFYNQRRSQKRNQFTAGTRDPDLLAPIEARRLFRVRGYKTLDALSRHEPLFAEKASEARRRRLAQTYFAYRLLSQAQHGRSEDFVNKAVQIVDRLSAAEKGGSYEFVLTRDGDFMIRPIGRAKILKEELLAFEEERPDLTLRGAVKPN